ncbi:hypothetical protein EDC94DRAFT_633993 [Helicostylum pulchrum]|nr:hypothetical protein EDC94DRAFT_633993 [Helicostylum pulchrum]
MEEVDICYTTDPRRPFLQCTNRIYGLPDEYRLYVTNKEEVEASENITFVDFINSVYRPSDEYYSGSLYSLKSVSIKEVFGAIWKYINRFDEKSLHYFTICALPRSVQYKKSSRGDTAIFILIQYKNKVDLLSVEPKRKVLKGEKQKLRSYLLSALDTKSMVMMKWYINNVASNIQNILPQHKAQISNLKENGLNIVGYCRKSDLDKQDNIVNLLQRMVDSHYQRSLVDKVFMSPCSNASSPFSERDLSDQCEVFSQLKSLHGDTQVMLNYIANNDNICIVSFDLAGLPTNISDLKEFVRNHKSIKKIIIDLFFYENDFKTFERDQLLNDNEVMKLFDCQKSDQFRLEPL